MSVVSLLTTAIKPLLKKGLPKRRVAELILDSGNFSKPSVFRPNRKYSGSFDKAWKEAGGKKYTQTDVDDIFNMLEEGDPLKEK